MEAPELPELDEPGHDHLDVDVGRVVPEVDQGERPLPELAHAVVAGPPVVEHGRVEGGLVQLVLDEQAPALGQDAIDLAQAVEIALERLPEVDLAREVAPVADPDRVRAGAQLHAEPEALEVVLHRLAAD